MRSNGKILAGQHFRFCFYFYFLFCVFYLVSVFVLAPLVALVVTDCSG